MLFLKLDGMLTTDLLRAPSPIWCQPCVECAYSQTKPQLTTAEIQNPCLKTATSLLSRLARAVSVTASPPFPRCDLAQPILLTKGRSNRLCSVCFGTRTPCAVPAGPQRLSPPHRLACWESCFNNVRWPLWLVLSVGRGVFYGARSVHSDATRRTLSELTKICPP